ncbi:V-set and immunoglobulin domain-containing protein 2 [Tiliqua scincoides]|uniref:V-set and immunoglobulin domain-containing protein 2 n=1 Tax=Tiliqua scincoides TaxID=71010 RepID=UPI0034623D42
MREKMKEESGGHGLCVEVTVPQNPVMQQRGLSVELPCHYKTSVDKHFVLEWKFAPGSTSPESGKQMLYFLDSVLYKPGSQEKRLSLLQDPPTRGDASIRLDDLHASDAGTYICEVNNPPDFYGTSIGVIHLVVLMPPSTPVCKGTTSVPVGSDATLTCESSEGVPAPIYSWTQQDSKTSLPLSNMVQNEKTGQLLLTNVSLAFSGTYRCVASNEFGEGSCQVSLLVTGRNTGVIAGAIIGVLLALLLLSAIVIYFLRYRKEKKKRKSMSIYSGNEIREDATAPGISESALLGRDSKSESHHFEKLSSRPESASTTKSQLNNILV